MGTNNHKSAWDDDRADELLRKLLPTGQSYGMIAAHINALEFGRDLSSSAVSGRVKRLGLSGPPRCAPKPRPERKTPFRPDPFNSTRYSGPPLPPLPIPPPVVTDATPERRVKLDDLRHDGCRYPLGEVGRPGFGFCPETQKAGSSYCPTHAARCTGWTNR